MPDQPAPALLAAARAYALSVWTYDPDLYRSAEHRDKHIHVDAVSTAREPWFAALWEAGLAEGRRQATEGPFTLSMKPLTDEQAAEWKALLKESMRTGRITVLPEPVEIRQRKWGVGHPGTRHVISCEDEAHAHEVADDLQQGHYVVSRLVGPWEPAEPEHAFDPASVRDTSVRPYGYLGGAGDDSLCVCGGLWLEGECETQQPGWTPPPPYDGPSLDELLPPVEQTEAPTPPATPLEVRADAPTQRCPSCGAPTAGIWPDRNGRAYEPCGCWAAPASGGVVEPSPLTAEGAK
jgi:hypothetical protein